MKDKLNAMPIEALVKLKQEVDAVFLARKYEVFKPGSFAKFTARGGKPVTMCVTHFGPKRVLGYMIDEQGHHLTRHKCACPPEILEPVFKLAPPPPIARGAGADMPEYATAGAF